MEEIWIPIKNYENYYISNLGRVKRRNIILKLSKNNTYTLYKDGKSKQFYIKTLIKNNIFGLNFENIVLNLIDIGFNIKMDKGYFIVTKDDELICKMYSDDGLRSVLINPEYYIKVANIVKKREYIKITYKRQKSREYYHNHKEEMYKKNKKYYGDYQRKRRFKEKLNKII